MSLHRGDPRIRIALLDDAVDPTAPELSRAYLEILGDSGKGSTAHGTHLAALLADLVPSCHLLSIPIFPLSGSRSVGRKFFCSQTVLAGAIDLAVTAGAHVINISGGQRQSPDQVDHHLEAALRRALDLGTLVVAAAGNDGGDPHVPANFDGVLAVGACDAHGHPLPFSNGGRDGVDLLAPGALALSGGNIRLIGTSAATAVVSGIAALLLSRQLQLGQRPDPLRLRDTLIASRRADHQLAVDQASQLFLSASSLQPKQVKPNQGVSTMSSEHNSIPQSETLPSPESLLPNVLPPETLPPETPPPEALPVRTDEGITASACACGERSRQHIAAPPGDSNVYVLGTLGFDFGSLSRRDSLAQLDGDGRLDRSEELLALLRQKPHVAEEVIWTLEIDDVAVYALRPEGPFASECHQHFAHLLADHHHGRIERVSIPGRLTHKTVSLLSGVEVPMLEPVLRGIHGWSTGALVSTLGQDQAEASDSDRSALTAVLERIYHELRNLGRSPRERALNYAATNAFQLDQVLRDAVLEGLELDDLDVVKGPISRPGASTWDVTITFFDPKRRQERARQVSRFTVDVSDVVPVAVGNVRRWSRY